MVWPPPSPPSTPALLLLACCDARLLGLQAESLCRSTVAERLWLTFWGSHCLHMASAASSATPHGPCGPAQPGDSISQIQAPERACAAGRPRLQKSQPFRTSGRSGLRSERCIAYQHPVLLPSQTAGSDINSVQGWCHSAHTCAACRCRSCWCTCCTLCRCVSSPTAVHDILPLCCRAQQASNSAANGAGPSGSSLATMFAPPTDILATGSFEHVQAQAQQQSRWLVRRG